MLISFDTQVTVAGTFYIPNDLVRFDGTDFSLFFNGFNLPRNANLDGAHVLDNGNILMTFDVAGVTTDGLRFADEDIIEFFPSSNAFDLNFSLNPLDTSWAGAGINALWAQRMIQGGVIRFDGIGIVEVMENAGSVTLAITRSGALEGVAGADWSTVAGTAGSADFIAIGGSVNYGEGVNDSRLITINLIDDGLQEDPVETFTVNIDAVTGSANRGSPRTVTVRILDDETILFRDGFEEFF